MLAPVLGELHRPAEGARRQRDEQLLGPRVVDLDAEAAADVGGDHVDLAEVEPSFTATAARTPVEVWVEVHTWSRPMSGSQRATVPRPSMGVQALRSMVRSSSSRCGAAAIAACGVADALLEPRADVAGHVVVDEVPRRAGGLDADDRRQELVGRP